MHSVYRVARRGAPNGDEGPPPANGRRRAGCQSLQLRQSFARSEAESATESSFKRNRVIWFTSFSERDLEDSLVADTDRHHHGQRKQLEQKRHQQFHLPSANDSMRRETRSAMPPESTQESATS